jgi:hypothetical protein
MAFPNHSGDRRLRVVSWNLLRRVGANVEDVARLVKSHHPDLLLLQECTEDIVSLPSLVGGNFFRQPMQSRIYGLAAWSPHALPQSTAIRLPYSILPGQVPPRLAQIIAVRGMTIAVISAMASFSTASSCAMSWNSCRVRRHHRRFQCRGPGGFQGFSISDRQARIAPARSSRCGWTAHRARSDLFGD